MILIINVIVARSQQSVKRLVVILFIIKKKRACGPLLDDKVTIEYITRTIMATSDLIAYLSLTC